ncbi:hypothetical protein [Salinispora fenicalii]|uniref:hypothetical protein n=1 Tax=Salinispora fenicalii TaxID=1137263 RepID=UPI0004AED4E9|nr:hypothetical protein [Salinispora fenicalii]
MPATVRQPLVAHCIEGGADSLLIRRNNTTGELGPLPLLDTQPTTLTLLVREY